MPAAATAPPPTAGPARRAVGVDSNRSPDRHRRSDWGTSATAATARAIATTAKEGPWAMPPAPSSTAAAQNPSPPWAAETSATSAATKMAEANRLSVYVSGAINLITTDDVPTITATAAASHAGRRSAEDTRAPAARATATAAAGGATAAIVNVPAWSRLDSVSM